MSRQVWGQRYRAAFGWAAGQMVARAIKNIIAFVGAHPCAVDRWGQFEMWKVSQGGRTKIVRWAMIIVAAVVIVSSVYACAFSTGKASGYFVLEEERALLHEGQRREREIGQCADHKVPKRVATCVAAVVEASERENHDARDLHVQKDMSQWAFWAMAIAGLQFFLSIITLVYLALTFEEARAATKAADDDLILNHPPKILVNRVAIWPAGRRGISPSMRLDSKIEGEAWAYNAGRHSAKIISGKLCVFWTNDELPMVSPLHMSKIPKYCEIFWLEDVNGNPWVSGSLLHNDEVSAKWSFNSTPPALSYKLYIIGEIEYLSSRGSRYYTSFARRYRVADKRFEIVDNPDYEDQG